jgi:carboxyl-terminal processing protease
MFRNDSANHTGRTYQTKGGRKVYGGGGISPDVFVPADSAEFLMFRHHEMVKAIMEEAAFVYYMRNQNQLKGITTPLQLQQRLQNDAAIWLIYNERAAKQDMSLNEFSSVYKNVLLRYLGARLAHFLWGRDGYFKMINLSDSMVQQALAEVKK